MTTWRKIAPQEWFSAAELAAMALPGLPTSKARVIDLAKRQAWADRVAQGGTPLTRARKGKGGGVEYHFSLLPDAARAQLVAANPAEVAQRPDRESMWLKWERLPASIREKAQYRLATIQRVEDLIRHGLGKQRALEEVVETEVRLARSERREPEFKVSTVYAWFRLIAGVEVSDRLVYLAPEYVGRVASEKCSAGAFEAYKADYLRPEKPTFAACYRRLERMAPEQGWSLPSAKTLQRRIEAEIPRDLMLFYREGDNALAHAFPHLERSRSGIGPLQIINLDGHTWDNMVLWPDGTKSRPYALAVQDIASSKTLAVRFDQTLNQHLVRLALADTFRDHGIPDTVIMDNGRENAAASISGGQATRWRWKVKEEEPAGLLKSLGIHAHFTQPYWGQAKPIERMFRDWADEIAKHPAFAGSYVGKNSASKPANYGERAIPIAEFEARVREELIHYNAQLGRKGAHMAGRSFDQVYAALVERQPPRQATPEQLRMCLLASQPVTMDPRTGSVRVADHRYWSEAVGGLKRQRVIVRFDPENLGADVHLYRLDGAYLAKAERIAAGSFDNVADAQRQGRLRRDYQKKTKAAADAFNRMEAEEVAALLPVSTPAPKAPKGDPKVVRPAFGAPRNHEAGLPATTPFEDSFSAGLAGIAKLTG